MLKDKIRTLLLKFLLPKKQYYIQADGMHSVFHDVFSDVMRVDYGAESNNTND